MLDKLFDRQAGHKRSRHDEKAMVLSA
jgi:hypothetical protein